MCICNFFILIGLIHIEHLEENPNVTFMINDLREGTDSKEYMEVLFQFSYSLYSESEMLRRAKTEEILTLLTPSDEAFILLLIIVYFEDHANTEYTKIFKKSTFVLRSGWQEAGVHLFNELYMKVQEDRLKNGEQFDADFRYQYSTSANVNGSKKQKEKRNLPIALNDLD